MERKRVLFVIQLVRRGGIELVAVNFARKLDKNKFDISFLLVDPYENQDEELTEELEQEGFKLIYMPENANSYADKYKFIDSLFRENHFDIVHSHVLLFSGFVCMAAKKHNVKIRAAHSHIIKWHREETPQYKLYKFLMQTLMRKYATHKFACSKKAGEFLYGKSTYEKSGIFIANGVDTGKFAFDLTKREKIRKEFSITDNDIFVGHIGTIYSIKNQVFLVEIVAQMIKKTPNLKCIMVGEELERDEVEAKAKSLGVLDNIIFAGQRSDIDSILQALDIMIFPSLHEALPVSLIEAQASKLPCLISDSVTTEVKFNENVDFMSLACPAEQWAKRAFELLDMDRKNISVEKLIEVYDIHSVCKRLEKFYLS